MTWRTITKGSKAEADIGLDELYALGIRQMVPTDKPDNAFSGTKGNDGFNGVATNLGNFAQNGSFLDMKPCAPGAPSDNPQLSADAIPQQDFVGLLTTLFGRLANLNPLPFKLPLYDAARIVICAASPRWATTGCSRWSNATSPSMSIT